jgi:hypothetical protein
VSVTRVAPVADHARYPEAAIAHPVAPVYPVSSEAGNDTQHPSARQDRLFRIVFRAGRDG